MLNLKFNCLPLLSLPLLMQSMPAFSEEPDDLFQTFSLASYYSKGDYAESTDTEILYVPLSYAINYGKFGVQLSVPHLQVSGVGNVLVNVGGVHRAVAGTQREKSSGIGDSVLSMTYQMEPVSAAALFVDLRLDVKLPSADENRGLGTGETDYSVQLDLSKNAGNSVLFATFGYSFRGKSNIYPGLMDSEFIQFGMARPLSQRWNIGVFYDFRAQASVFSSEIHELAPYFSWQFSRNWTFTGMTSWGFTDASANVTALGQLSYRW
jgi:hypothetical protein